MFINKLLVTYNDGLCITKSCGWSALETFKFTSCIHETMGLAEQKWWQKLFKREEGRKKIDLSRDFDGINDFLADMVRDRQALVVLFEQLKELEEERQVATHVALKVNLQSQVTLLQDILDRYNNFEDDVQINGIRLRIIAAELLKKAEKAGLKDAVKDKRDLPEWHKEM